MYNECLQRLVCDHFDTLKNECNELIIKEDLDGKKTNDKNSFFDLILCIALNNMYKLLKPTSIGINYMVEKLQDYISRISHEKIQTLKGENVCEGKKQLKFDLSRNLFSSYQHYSLTLYWNYIRNTLISSEKRLLPIPNLFHHWIKLVRLL